MNFRNIYNIRVISGGNAFCRLSIASSHLFKFLLKYKSVSFDIGTYSINIYHS